MTAPGTIEVRAQLPKQWHIYTLSDPRDGAVRYVGYTRQGIARFHAHLTESRRGKGSAKCNWIRDVESVGAIPGFAVVETGEGDGWPDAERKWITYHRERGADLTNRVEGGGGPPVNYRPPPFTAKHRANMSAAKMGKKLRPMSAQARANIAAAQRRRVKRAPPSTEVRERIAASLTGKKLSAEHRANVAASMLGKKRGAYSIDSDEHRAKIAARVPPMLGRKHSEETLAKMRAAFARRNPAEKAAAKALQVAAFKATMAARLTA